MTLELGVAVRTEQQLRALPALLQAVALVPLPQELLEARVARELASNPMLRRGPQPTCASCGSRRVDGRCPRCSGPPRGVTELTTDPFGSLAALARCELGPADRDAVPVVVDHLTGRGLLDADPARIAMHHRLPLASVEAAIRAVRAVGPPGIARRTVGELLADQARHLVAAGEAPAWVVHLVRDHHLDDPFAWLPGDTGLRIGTTPEMHLVAFVPGHHLFHRARNAMDGLLPDGTRLPVPASQSSINSMIQASHRQPRNHRSFPLAEFLT